MKNGSSASCGPGRAIRPQASARSRERAGGTVRVPAELLGDREDPGPGARRRRAARSAHRNRTLGDARMLRDVRDVTRRAPCDLPAIV